MLATRTLVGDASLLATNLARATDRSVGLSETGAALTGRGITLLARWAVIDALILTARLPTSTLDRTTHPTRARLTGLALRLAVAAMVAVDLGVDALVVAHRAVVAALAVARDTVMTGRADITAAAAVVWVGLETDAVLRAARTVGKAAGGILRAIAQVEHQLGGTGDRTRRVLVVAESVTPGERTAVLGADQEELVHLGATLGTVADLRRGGVRDDRGDATPKQERGDAPEHAFEHLATRARGPYDARQIVEAAFFHGFDHSLKLSQGGTEASQKRQTQ
jgi:hypothetical protein